MPALWVSMEYLHARQAAGALAAGVHATAARPTGADRAVSRTDEIRAWFPYVIAHGGDAGVVAAGECPDCRQTIEVTQDLDFRPVTCRCHGREWCLEFGVVGTDNLDAS